MTRMGAIGNGLQAAWMFARGDAQGAALLTAEPDAEWLAAKTSFWAIFLCLPAVLCVYLVDPPSSRSGAGIGRLLLGELLDWTGFAVLTHILIGQAGLALRWPRYIAAWNWCNLLQALMMVGAVIPTLLGMPDAVRETAGLVVVGWGLWLEWFATRVTLGIPGAAAFLLVAMDVLLSSLVSVMLSRAF